MAKAIYYGSICVDNILPELVKIGSDGKAYVSVRIVEKDEADQYGNTAFIVQSVKKEEQREGVRYSLGNLKPVDAEAKPQAQTADVEAKLAALKAKLGATEIPANDKGDDLPF